MKHTEEPQSNLTPKGLPKSSQFTIKESSFVSTIIKGVYQGKCWGLD